MTIPGRCLRNKVPGTPTTKSGRPCSASSACVLFSASRTHPISLRTVALRVSRKKTSSWWIESTASSALSRVDMATSSHPADW